MCVCVWDGCSKAVTRPTNGLSHRYICSVHQNGIICFCGDYDIYNNRMSQSEPTTQEKPFFFSTLLKLTMHTVLEYIHGIHKFSDDVVVFFTATVASKRALSIFHAIVLLYLFFFGISIDCWRLAVLCNVLLYGVTMIP